MDRSHREWVQMWLAPIWQRISQNAPWEVNTFHESMLPWMAVRMNANRRYVSGQEIQRLCVAGEPVLALVVYRTTSSRPYYIFRLTRDLRQHQLGTQKNLLIATRDIEMSVMCKWVTESGQYQGFDWPRIEKAYGLAPGTGEATLIKAMYVAFDDAVTPMVLEWQEKSLQFWREYLKELEEYEVLAQRGLL